MELILFTAIVVLSIGLGVATTRVILTIVVSLMPRGVPRTDVVADTFRYASPTA
jgi:hypothetical protein